MPILRNRNTPPKKIQKNFFFENGTARFQHETGLLSPHSPARVAGGESVDAEGTMKSTATAAERISVGEAIDTHNARAVNTHLHKKTPKTSRPLRSSIINRVCVDPAPQLLARRDEEGGDIVVSRSADSSPSSRSRAVAAVALVALAALLGVAAVASTSTTTTPVGGLLGHTFARLGYGFTGTSGPEEVFESAVPLLSFSDQPQHAAAAPRVGHEADDEREATDGESEKGAILAAAQNTLHVADSAAVSNADAASDAGSDGGQAAAVAAAISATLSSSGVTSEAASSDLSKLGPKSGKGKGNGNGTAAAAAGAGDTVGL